MKRPSYRAWGAGLICALCVLLASAPRGTLAGVDKPPLTEQQLFALLEANEPSSRISEIVDERGIAFDLTTRIEQRVRDDGGDDNLVAALRRAAQRREESDRPRTGELVVKSTPGEAEVYLNDEPLGMTSREGEIRLPGLQAGSYKLRVSLLGYQSFEVTQAVEAGETQTVYVTLAPRGNVGTPQNNPASVHEPAATGAESNLPVAGAKVSAMQFFEGPHNEALQQSQRVYRDSFDRATTRSVWWELSLQFPSPQQRVDFSIDAYWYKSDGSQMTRQTFATYVLPAWKSSLHTLGYGWVDSGHWTPGPYRVDLYYKGRRIASGNFQIN